MNKTIEAMRHAQRFLEGKAHEAKASGLTEDAYHYSEAFREIGLAIMDYRISVLNEAVNKGESHAR